jgi:photosystem II stability/assembly factor-like uncharacterized protein
MKHIRPLVYFVVFAIIGSCTMLMGQRWEAVPLQPPYHATLWLDVYFLPSNPQFGWVCGAKGHVIRTTDAGATWQGTTVPYSPSNNDHLESIHFVNTSIGYTSGNAVFLRAPMAEQHGRALLLQVQAILYGEHIFLLPIRVW